MSRQDAKPTFPATPGGDDFDDQLTLMLAAWLIQGLSNWRMDNVPAWQADASWGLSSLRRRLLGIVANLLRRPNLAALPLGLAGVVGDLDRACRAAWNDFTPMSVYPAFRTGAAAGR